MSRDSCMPYLQFHFFCLKAQNCPFVFHSEIISPNLQHCISIILWDIDIEVDSMVFLETPALQRASLRSALTSGRQNAHPLLPTPFGKSARSAKGCRIDLGPYAWYAPRAGEHIAHHRESIRPVYDKMRTSFITGGNARSSKRCHMGS